MIHTYRCPSLVPNGKCGGRKGGAWGPLSLQVASFSLCKVKMAGSVSAYQAQSLPGGGLLGTADGRACVPGPRRIQNFDRLEHP